MSHAGFGFQKNVVLGRARVVRRPFSGSCPADSPVMANFPLEHQESATKQTQEMDCHSQRLWLEETEKQTGLGNHVPLHGEYPQSNSRNINSRAQIP